MNSVPITLVDRIFLQPGFLPQLGRIINIHIGIKVESIVYSLVSALLCIRLLCYGKISLLASGQQELFLQRPHLAHAFHASCNHNIRVSCPYWLGCKAYGFEAWPTDHLAAPRWNRVRDSCTHAGLSNGILPTTWKREHRDFSAITEKQNVSLGSCHFPAKLNQATLPARQKKACIHSILATR